MVALPDLPQPLSDGVVRLRPLAERDIPDVLIAYEDDPELHVSFGIDRPPSAADLGRRSERAAEDRAALRGVTLTVLAGDSDTSLGELNVHHIVPAHARGELGLWLAASARGRGIGTRALRLASEWLFGTCGFERLAILTDPGNAGMRASAERAGFRLEGILRGYTLERGRRVDSALLARLASDG